MNLITRFALSLWLVLCMEGAFVQSTMGAAEDKTAGTEVTAASAWTAPEPWRTDRFYLQTSVATVHFSSDPKHDKTQDLIYGEWRLRDYWLGGQALVGASFFDNSFGQTSQFVFGGLLWRPLAQQQPFYVKLAVGVLHGYRGEFKNKVPYNSTGYAPGIVPGIGYCYDRYCGEMILFGTAGILWTVGVTLP